MTNKKLLTTLIAAIAAMLILNGCGTGNEGIVGTGVDEKKPPRTTGFQYDGSIRIVTD